MAAAMLAAPIPVRTAPVNGAPVDAAPVDGAPARRAAAAGAVVHSLGAAGPRQLDDAVTYACFRRAIVERDQRAWAALDCQYRPLVRHWVYQHPAWPGSGDDADYWTNRAFERFFVAVTPERFAAFPALPSLLRYLKLCVHSTLLDAVRAREAVALHLLEEDEHPSGEDVAERVSADLSGSELWAAILGVAQDEQERLAAQLCLALGMAPRAVHARCPEQFPSVADVYRVKRNLLDRLRRSPGIRAFREGGCDEGRPLVST